MKTEKRCPRCATLKPVSHFGFNHGSADGYRSACRACDAARQRARYAELIASRSGNPPAPPDPDKTPSVEAPRFSAPPPAPLPPLENAFAQHTEAATKRNLKAEHKALIEEVRRQRELLEALRPLNSESNARIPPAPPPEKGEAVPLLLLSDLHLEEEVELEKMHGVNEYSLKIAEQRMHSYFRNSLRLMDMVARDSLVRRACVGLLGDTFSGSIHPELMEINQLGPQPAARFAKDLLVAGIRYWLDNSDLTFEFNCVGGNHGRMTEKTRISTNAENSLEIFAYHFLAAEFKTEPRVTFRIAAGDMLYSDIFPNYRVRFIHGDQISFGGGVGGLTIPLNKWVARQDQSIKASLTVLGHFHQCLDGGRFLVNGSLIGASPYSQRYGFSPEPPQQQFALIHPKHGKSIVAPVWVTE